MLLQPQFTKGLLLLQLFTTFCPLSPTLLSLSAFLLPLLSCVAPFHLPPSLLLLLYFHNFRTFPLLSTFTCLFSLFFLGVASFSSRTDGLSAKFTSSVSLCSTEDVDERWSCQFCFLSLLCVATCIAELAEVDVSLRGSSPPPCHTLK